MIGYNTITSELSMYFRYPISNAKIYSEFHVRLKAKANFEIVFFY